jgi:hypothetical protein
MERTAGIWVLAAGWVAFALVVVVVRPRVPPTIAYLLVALCGATLATGALMVQEHVEPAEWLLAVPVAAALGIANIRALFAGSGPLRT